MRDCRTRRLLGQSMIILFGPLCLLASLLLVNLSGEGVSDEVMMVSYLVFMLALAAFAGGAYLWITARQRMR